MISKASRTGILRLVPGDLQDEAKALVMATRRQDDAKDPATARNRVFDAFAAIGVRPTELEEYLGHPVDSMSPAEREKLLGLHAAIKEGEVTWADAKAQELAARESERDAAPVAKPPAPAAQPSAPPAAPAPRQSEASVPPAEPQREVAPARQRNTGKGTAALKGALTGAGKAPPAPPKPDPAPTTIPRPADDDEDPDPAWMGRPELPPDEPPPRRGFKDRKCANPTCNAVVEVEIGAPQGQRCYACSQA